MIKINKNHNFLPPSVISLGAEISVEGLPHSVLPQYLLYVWHVFSQVFVDI